MRLPTRGIHPQSLPATPGLDVTRPRPGGSVRWKRVREEAMDRLKGKIILISGGARGQGAAEARLFVAEGARVVIGDVLEAEGKRLASELGDAAIFVPQDV